jgi:hypothetical protein
MISEFVDLHASISICVPDLFLTIERPSSHVHCSLSHGRPMESCGDLGGLAATDMSTSSKRTRHQHEQPPALTSAALHSREGSYIDVGGSDSDSHKSLETEFSRTTSSRPSSTLGPSRKAKKRATLLKRLQEKEGGLQTPWKTPDQIRKDGAAAAIYKDGQCLNARGSVASNWYANIVGQMQHVSLEDTGFNVFRMFSELELAPDMGENIEEFDKQIVDACEATFLLRRPADGHLCMVCNKSVWDTIPYSETKDPHRSSNDHKRVSDLSLECIKVLMTS